MMVGLELSEGTAGLDVHSGFLTLVLGTWAGTARTAWGRLVSLSPHAASSWVWTSSHHGGPKSQCPKRQKAEAAGLLRPEARPWPQCHFRCVLWLEKVQSRPRFKGRGIRISPLDGSDTRAFVAFFIPPQPPSARVYPGPETHQRLFTSFKPQSFQEIGTMRCPFYR